MSVEEKLDRLIHAYKGPHGHTCIVDQAVRPMPDGSRAIIFMTGGSTEPHIDNYIALCRSTDDGATWAEPETVLRYDDRACLLSEATVIDGTLTVYGYTHGGFFEDWTDIPNPGSKVRLFRLSDGRHLLLLNPNDTPGVRNPLALWISDDDMRTWSYRRTITDFPGQLPYPDGYVDENEEWVHFAIDYNRHDLIAISSRLPG